MWVLENNTFNLEVTCYYGVNSESLINVQLAKLNEQLNFIDLEI